MTPEKRPSSKLFYQEKHSYTADLPLGKSLPLKAQRSVFGNGSRFKLATSFDCSWSVKSLYHIVCPARYLSAHYLIFLCLPSLKQTGYFQGKVPDSETIF